MEKEISICKNTVESLKDNVDALIAFFNNNLTKTTISRIEEYEKDDCHLTNQTVIINIPLFSHIGEKPSFVKTDHTISLIPMKFGERLYEKALNLLSPEDKIIFRERVKY